MVSIRFTSLALGILLIFIVLIVSSAYAYEDSVVAAKGKGLGRKMIMGKKLIKVHNEEEKSSNLSGKDDNALSTSLMRSMEHVKDEVSVKNLENDKIPARTNLVKGKTELESRSSSPSKQASNYFPEEGESEGLLDEIAHLMHKDYQGFNKPRCKPPINNQVPLH